ncbi:hotdog fold domain-containing protein [Sorangium sp. So ce861]|uniref:hotdog fold domain-containing protein n=1 Tax=Sorangium sp. So ce861 TaxID=3133323 RepID=UPI003F648CB1
MNLSDFSLASIAATSRRNTIRDLWDKLHHLPGGKRVFSRLIGAMAPYTGTIRAHIEVLERGRAEVWMRDLPGLRNHLRSVHAVALVNLAELTANTALAYALPDDARFIVAGLSIEYLKKARGTIRAVCECPVPDTSERREYQIPVSLLDATGAEVARAVLRSLVGPKKQP